MDNYDTITTDDKAKRDDIFRQLRTSSDPLERASVKYSGNRPVMSVLDPSEQQLTETEYSAKVKGVNIRPLYVSTWSVATPRPKAGS